MKATLRTGPQQRLQLEAVAGAVVLQVIQTPNPSPQAGWASQRVLTISLTPTQAGALCDMLAGVGCVAEEQAFDIDVAVAMAASGLPQAQVEAALEDQRRAAP
jgi:hypothetical protein